MKSTILITTRFIFGGVLLTSRVGSSCRKRAATNFRLELFEMEDRHHATVDTYRSGVIDIVTR